MRRTGCCRRDADVQNFDVLPMALSWRSSTGGNSDSRQRRIHPAVAGRVSHVRSAKRPRMVRSRISLRQVQSLDLQPKRTSSPVRHKAGPTPRLRCECTLDCYRKLCRRQSRLPRTSQASFRRHTCGSHRLLATCGRSPGGRGADWLWVVLFVARRVCFGERWPQRYECGVVRRHFLHWGEPSGG